MKFAKKIHHSILYKDPYCYLSHPHIVRVNSREILVVFNRAVRHPFILHPPVDPDFRNFVTRSFDEGNSWTEPQVVPGYEWYGMECAGLTRLLDNTILLNQWQFLWYPLDVALKRPDREQLTFPDAWAQELRESAELETGFLMPPDSSDLFPWVRGNGGAYIHRSLDGGRTWEKAIKLDTRPYEGGYGMRGAVQMKNGVTLLPLCDVPNYKNIFILRSEDNGRSWSPPIYGASLEGHFFEEPCALMLPDERILLIFRDNVTHSLYQCFSEDGGFTWDTPLPTGILGYPAHLLQLPDGRIANVCGFRIKPYGIRILISSDQGKSWDIKNPLYLVSDLPNKNLGYPSSILLNNGQLLTVYYAEDQDGVTCIHSVTCTL